MDGSAGASYGPADGPPQPLASGRRAPRRELHGRRHDRDVLDHDYPSWALGRAIPSGVYDLVNNQGWVSVGIDHDTAQFATNSIRRWWHEMGQARFPKAKELLYTGRLVKAEEAERIGLLNQLVPCAELRETSIQIAQLISKNDSRMVQGIKRLLHEDVGMDWRGRYDNEQSARKTYLKANSPREGFKDFLARKGIR